MNDNEIKKALFILRNGSSEGERKYFEAIEIIENEYNRQKAEIKQKDTEIDILIRKNENLKDEVSELRAEVERLQKEQEIFGEIGKLYSEVKADAYNEFAERYVEQIRSYTGIYTDEIGFAISYDAIISAVNFVCDELTERKEDEGK